jgi:tol-pal system protein YbgF
MRLRLSLCAFLFIPLAAFAAPQREIVELQRDISTLQDQMRALQAMMTEKLAALTVLTQQAVDGSNNTGKSMAVLESHVSDRLDKQLANVGQPVAVIGAKVDQMSNDFVTMRESLNDVVSRMGKLEQKIVDLNNSFRTMQAPPPAPGAPTAQTVPAATLYDAADRDRMSGKADMALKEFTDYVQAYGDTDRAPNAQFWIGQIHFEQSDFETAVKDFDLVIEKYPASDRTADALYMKGQALVKLNKKTDGAKEFRAILTQFPTSNIAPKACTHLRELGYSCPPPAAARKKTR